MKTKTTEVAYRAQGAKAPYIKRELVVRQPTHEEISAHARKRWEKLGRPEGQDEAIWLDSERALLAGEDIPTAEQDAQADTRQMLGEDSGTIEDRLSPFGDQNGDRSSTSL